MESRYHAALALALTMVMGLAACRKEDDGEVVPDQPMPSSMTLRLEHHMDGVLLAYDTMLYTTESGALYSVSRVEYYLSEIVLLGNPGTLNDTLHGPFYVNGHGPTSYDLGTPRSGSYAGAELLLGLPASMNVTGGLPATLENVNMAWPLPMGGGYHFIKFEGHFIASGNAVGFAMHVGGNDYLTHASLPQPFIMNANSGTLLIRFNLNELFRSPSTYDLASWNYSMGDMSLMGRLRDNAADAFTIACLP